MDYEKKYKDALEKARQLCVYPTTKPFISDLQDLFPELKESEDDKVKDAAIEFVRQNKSFNCSLGISKEEVIAWLEKQGETFTKRDIDDAYLEGVTNTKNEIEKQYEANYQIRKDIATFIFNYKGNIKDRTKWIDYLGINVSFVEKQGKQKPAFEMMTPEESLGIDSDTYNKIVDECIYGKQKPDDKVEPKFHEGEWVVNTVGDTNQVVKVLDDGYTLDDNTFLSNSWATEHYHLYTIQDAKAGDVLAVTMYPEGTWIGIFKEHDGCTFSSYCFVNTEGTFKLGTYNHGYGRAIHPATKEQRDTFMKAMTDAGYTFDFEKKKLKKIGEPGNFKNQVMSEITDLVF